MMDTENALNHGYSFITCVVALDTKGHVRSKFGPIPRDDSPHCELLAYGPRSLAGLAGLAGLPNEQLRPVFRYRRCIAASL